MDKEKINLKVEYGLIKLKLKNGVEYQWNMKGEYQGKIIHGKPRFMKDKPERIT